MDDRIPYVVTLSVDEEDVLRRVAVLTAAFYRIVAATKLLRVTESDYENGRLIFVIEARFADPMVVPGEVHARFELQDEVEVDARPAPLEPAR